MAVGEKCCTGNSQSVSLFGIATHLTQPYFKALRLTSALRLQMALSESIDLLPLERRLHDLLQSLRTESDQGSWLNVKTTSEEIANALRCRNAQGMSF